MGVCLRDQHAPKISQVEPKITNLALSWPILVAPCCQLGPNLTSLAHIFAPTCTETFRESRAGRQKVPHVEVIIFTLHAYAYVCVYINMYIYIYMCMYVCLPPSPPLQSPIINSTSRLKCNCNSSNSNSNNYGNNHIGIKCTEHSIKET